MAAVTVRLHTDATEDVGIVCELVLFWLGEGLSLSGLTYPSPVEKSTDELDFLRIPFSFGKSQPLAAWLVMMDELRRDSERESCKCFFGFGPSPSVGDVGSDASLSSSSSAADRTTCQLLRSVGRFKLVSETSDLRICNKKKIKAFRLLFPHDSQRNECD